MVSQVERWEWRQNIGRRCTDRVQEVTGEISGVEGGRDNDFSLEKAVIGQRAGSGRVKKRCMLTSLMCLARSLFGPSLLSETYGRQNW